MIYQPMMVSTLSGADIDSIVVAETGRTPDGKEFVRYQSGAVHVTDDLLQYTASLKALADRIAASALEAGRRYLSDLENEEAPAGEPGPFDRHLSLVCPDIGGRDL